MVRYLPRIILLALMSIAGLFGLSMYEKGTTGALLKEKDQIIEAERQKNQLLRGIVQRLQTDRRMARIIALDQSSKDGKSDTTILFSEYNREGTALLPDSMRQFTLEGSSVYVDTYVVEFDDKLVEENDPRRGHSIAFFRRIFGRKGPDAGYDLVSSSGAPLGHQSNDPQQAAMEKQIWSDFWKLSEDPKLRNELGVKRAFGVSAFHEDFKPGFIYTLTLDPRGGLRMDTEPVDPLLERALKQKSSSARE